MNWQESWNKRYKLGFFGGFAILIIILALYPFFCSFIQDREGTVLHDPVLTLLEPHDLSYPIFVIIWGMTILILVRCIQSPATFLVFLWSYIFLFLSRIILISAIPLAPPPGLIELKDPLTDYFYGGKFISKDLFYSGHTATQFLIFLALKGRTEKAIALCCTVAIGGMVLIQHVHYAIDVAAAPIFAFMIFRGAKLFCQQFFLS